MPAGGRFYWIWKQVASLGLKGAQQLPGRSSHSSMASKLGGGLTSGVPQIKRLFLAGGEPCEDSERRRPSTYPRSRLFCQVRPPYKCHKHAKDLIEGSRAWRSYSTVDACEELTIRAIPIHTTLLPRHVSKVVSMDSSSLIYSHIDSTMSDDC